MIHLDRNPADQNQNQNSNLISSGDQHSTTTTAPTTHFHWEAIHDRDDTRLDFVDSIRSSDTLLDFAVAKDRPPTTHDVVHEDKSSPLSPAPDSASPNHESKDLPQQPVQPNAEPPGLDKGELDVPREGTLTPLTDLSPAPELDDDTEKKDDEENNLGESSQFNSGSSLRDDVKRDTKGKGDAPLGAHVNGISSSSSSRSIDGSPARHKPSNPSAFQNASDLRLADKFAIPSHSPAPSSDFMTPPIIHAPHNMPPPNMAHASNNAKVIRILELNAELFHVCLEFQARSVPIADHRFQQYAQRLQSNLTWLAAAADQRHHHPSVALPIMTPPTAVEFSPARLQRLYSDMPEVFSKEIARRKMHNANVNVPSSHPHHNQTPHALSPSNGLMHLKRNRSDDVPDLSTSKRRDVGDGKMHASSLSPSSVSPNPTMPGSTGMPPIPVPGPGHGPGPGSGQGGPPGSGMNSGVLLASGMGAIGSAGLRASPDTFAGPTGVSGMTAPGTPHIPQSPTASASSNMGMPHPPSATSPSSGMPGISIGGMSGMQSGTGTVAISTSAPGASSHASFGTGDTAVANLRRLQMLQHQSREQQIRQQQQQQAAQMQQMQQTQGGAAAPRHMSPPTSAQATQGVGGIGGGGGAGVPSNQPQQPSSSQQAQLQQLIQVLQNPSHPHMQYITQHVPNFSALPMPQQLQKLQLFQQALAHRNQQAAAQRNPQLGGMHSNAGMAGGLSNGTMTGGSGNGRGSSPVSPLGQQAPTMSQPQQIPSQQSSQNGMFPYGQQHGGGGGSGIDPRMAGVAGGSNFSQQMPGNMGNVNINQQRQLMLMQQQQQQQQQQMRNMNGNLNISGGVSAAGMMNSQQHGTYGMNSRMMGQLGVSSQQQQPQPPQPPGAAGGGSPMVPINDTFPTLRSNSTIPGIARSTRSPSDGVHSPMTPRAPSRLSHQQTPNEYQAMLQQQQHAQAAFSQGAAWPQGAQTQMGQVNGYAMSGSMNSPNGIGGAFFSGSPSPSNQSWQQGGGGMAGVGGYGYGHGQSTMGGGQRPPDQVRPRMGGGTPTPQAGGGSAPPSATQNMSPIGPDMTGNVDYDIFNPYVNGQ